MGICCAPQTPANEDNLRIYNKGLKKIINDKIIKYKSLWAIRIKESLKAINSNSLYTFQYQNDINQFIQQAHQAPKNSSNRTRDQQYKKELINSCFIPEDQAEILSNPSQDPQLNSFNSKMQKNPSLMIQFQTIFKPFLQQGHYKQSTKLFLSWVVLARKHLELGFLAPLYKAMAIEMINIINRSTDSDVVLKKLQLQIQSFSELMYHTYKQIYKFYEIEKSPKAKLFKEQNINHFIICSLFDTENLMKLLRSSLLEKDKEHIQGFQMRRRLLEGKKFEFFNIDPKFQLISPDTNITESGSVGNIHSYPKAINALKKITLSQTPISKLKILLQVQKQIVKQITNHYTQLKQQIPEIDPDLIASLTMYVVVKSKVKQLPVDLSIIETFASKNALNSISGYYISTFNVAISMIDSFQE